VPWEVERADGVAAEFGRVEGSIEALLAAAKAMQQDQQVITLLAELGGDIEVEFATLQANHRLNYLHDHAVPEGLGGAKRHLAAWAIFLRHQTDISGLWPARL
jgi:phage tail protein X